MKGIIKFALALSLIAAVIFQLGVLAGAEDGETIADEADYVRFTSEDYDPYATFEFSPDGNNYEIDPDVAVWCAIRYRTITADTEKGIELGGQIYVTSAKEPYVPVIYNHTGNWETVIVDMTAISITKEGMEPVWNSEGYSKTETVRFDPMEPNRENPEFDNDNDRGKVRDGSQIDIAWIAFFETKEAAEAYTGKENTPYCIVTAEELENPVSSNRIEVERITNSTPTPTAAPATATPEAAETAEITEAPEATEAPEITKAPEAGDDNSGKSGCGSVIGVCGVAVVLAAGIVIRKKEI